MLDKNVKIFIVYITFFTSKITIFLAHKTWIASFLAEKLPY